MASESSSRWEQGAEVSRLTLLLDADDTLWENNIYFLELTERFLETVASLQVDLDAARQLLIETERKNIPVHGYGSRAFAVSLVEAYESLSGGPDPEVAQRLRDLAHAIFDRDKPEVRPDVEDTLRELSRHHRLILVTKGDAEEQRRKVERSGLAPYFEVIEVVPEKSEAVYRRIVRDLGADPRSTWMIGNSPKSDINPALAAGLNAILVPHPWTWELELEEVRQDSERLIIVGGIGEVLGLFVPRAPAQTCADERMPSGEGFA